MLGFEADHFNSRIGHGRGGLVPGQGEIRIAVMDDRDLMAAIRERRRQPIDAGSVSAEIIGWIEGRQHGDLQRHYAFPAGAGEAG